MSRPSARAGERLPPREIGATPRDTQAMCDAIDALRADLATERAARLAAERGRDAMRVATTLAIE